MSGNYASMGHEQIYRAVIVGQPQTVEALAQALEDHGNHIVDANSRIKTSMAALREAWQGATADRYLADLGTLSSYLDHLTSVLHTSGSSYAQVLRQTSSDLARSQTPAALPPPTQGPAKPTMGTVDPNDDRQAIAALKVYGNQEQQYSAWQASENANHQQCIQTISTLAGDYQTAQARMQPPDPAPGVAGSTTAGSPGAGGSEASAPVTGAGPSPHDTSTQGGPGSGYLWQPTDGGPAGHHGVSDPGPVQTGSTSPGGVIGGQPGSPGSLAPAAYTGGAIGTDAISATGGGLSGTEIAGIAALGGAGVIGAIAARNQLMSAAAARAALSAEESAEEQALLAGNRAGLLAEEQAEQTALSGARANGTIMSAEQAALARQGGAGSSAATASRGAMRPGRGVIGGEQTDSERTTWLEEDRDVWGVGDHVAPVVGQRPAQDPPADE